VLIGHFHHAYERREDGRELVMLGDWIDRCTYAVLEGGQLRLEHWDGAREAAPATATGSSVRTPR
jgi:hypothetical protein